MREVCRFTQTSFYIYFPLRFFKYIYIFNMFVLISYFFYAFFVFNKILQGNLKINYYNFLSFFVITTYFRHKYVDMRNEHPRKPFGDRY